MTFRSIAPKLFENGWRSIIPLTHEKGKPDRPEQSATVHFRDPLRGIVYVSREQVREVGYQNLQRNVAQADDKIRIFSYRHELPDHALSLHDAALRGEGGA